MSASGSTHATRRSADPSRRDSLAAHARRPRRDSLAPAHARRPRRGSLARPAHARRWRRGSLARPAHTRRSPGVALVALGLALALAACAPTTVRVPTTPGASMAAGGLTRSVGVLYDLDDVRDVADVGGTLAVATDLGVLLFADEAAPPTRVLNALPSPDVRALAATVDGALVVGTLAGVVQLRGGVAEPLGAPPVGELVALEATTDGALWACGSVGLARRVDGEWQTFGEPFECTGLWPSPEERLWVGGTRGLIYLDQGDVIREHGETSGLPGGYVRGVVPMGGGRAMALVQGPSDAWLAYYDTERWFSYTAPGLDRRAIALERLGGDAILVTPDHAFVIRDAARSTGVPLHPLAHGDRGQSVAYRARLGGAREHAARTSRPAVSLASIPANAPTLLAPGFGVAHLARVGDAIALARSLGDRVIVADRNRGVVALRASGLGARMTSRSLVADRDLQIAQDARGRAHVIDGLGRVGAWDGDAFARVAPPADARLHAIASGPRGVYAAATVPDDPTALRVYRREGDAWAIVLERRVPAEDAEPSAAAEPGPGATPSATGSAASSGPAASAGSARSTAGSAGAPGSTAAATAAPATSSEPTTGDAAPAALTLVALPFLGVANDETAWVALRARDRGRERAFGVVQLDPRSDDVLHHHAGRPAGGRGALQLPDEVTGIDLGQEGFAWFGSVVGAVRIGNFQSVTFGEARGVRGEVVSDVLVGAANKVWVAAAEGPGYYFRQTFEFRMPQAVRDARPLALALDAQGHVWGAGPRGLVRYDGSDWLVIGEGSSLPTTDLVDVETDAEGRLWILARDRVLVLGPGRRVE
ncbi:MAG: hypothetical protein KF901_02370 [Myxococcales bacterium]|nr:hypothetical protein [Myxococcales bacterium]